MNLASERDRPKSLSVKFAVDSLVLELETDMGIVGFMPTSRRQKVGVYQGFISHSAGRVDEGCKMRMRVRRASESDLMC